MMRTRVWAMAPQATTRPAARPPGRGMSERRPSARARACGSRAAAHARGHERAAGEQKPLRRVAGHPVSRSGAGSTCADDLR